MFSRPSREKTTANAERGERAMTRRLLRGSAGGMICAIIFLGTRDWGSLCRVSCPLSFGTCVGGADALIGWTEPAQAAAEERGEELQLQPANLQT